MEMRTRAVALTLGLLAACSTGASRLGSDGSPIGVGSEGSSATHPASQRISDLRTLQTAPGYELTNDGATITGLAGKGSLEAHIRVAGDRVQLTPERGDFDLAIHTLHVGRKDAWMSLAGSSPNRADGQEAVLARQGIEERYLAGPLGLEQSYRIEARPSGAGPLEIEVGFEGLRPVLSAGAENLVRLEAADGSARAIYRDLSAVDASGHELAARMEVSGNAVRLVVDDTSAAYPLFIDPLAAVAEAKIVANDGAVGDFFGDSVSISGDTAIFGASGIANSLGGAYVFTRTGTTWTLQAKLAASDGAPGDQFGAAVSINGNTAVVGATANGNGSAYVFVRNGTTWSQQAKLVAADGAAGDAFGGSVDVDADTIAIGAWKHNASAGAGYVFTRTGTTWTQQAKLVAADGAAGDELGGSLSLSADTIVAGASKAANVQGAAYVFTRSGTTWSQQTKLVASDGAAGDTLGASVSISTDTALIGAVGKDQGVAYVFTRAGSAWSQQAELVANDGTNVDHWFGNAVSIAGDTAVVGDFGNNQFQGAGYLFARSGSTWSPAAKFVASDGFTNDHFGEVVDISANTIVVGASSSSGFKGSANVYVTKIVGATCGVPTDCASGFCVDGVCCNSACNGGVCDACSVAAGAAIDGICDLFSGAQCDDGNACTQIDSCVSGVCSGSFPVDCVTMGGCQASSTCDPATGMCAVVDKPDGTLCQFGTCQGGFCTEPTSSSASSSSSSSSAPSTTSSSSSSSSGSGGGSNNDMGTTSGCGCVVAADPTTDATAAAAAAGLLGMLARRRKRRRLRAGGLP